MLRAQIYDLSCSYEPCLVNAAISTVVGPWSYFLDSKVVIFVFDSSNLWNVANTLYFTICESGENSI